MTVSVVIPIRNAASSLERCVRSVCGQSHGDLEIILVNDGSIDGSGHLCERLACEDRRISVIHQENRGAGAARNAGLDAATGEFVQFLDSDDTLIQAATELLLRRIVRDQADIVICGHRRIECQADGAVVRDWPQRAAQPGRFDRKQFLSRFSECDYLVYIGWEYCWDRILSRDFLERNKVRFPEGMTLCEDRIFNLTCFAAANALSVVPDLLCCHYLPSAKAVRPSASTQADETRWAAHQKSFDLLLTLLGENDCLSSAVKRAIYQDYVNTMVVAAYRACRADLRATFGERVAMMKRICRHPMMQEALRTYSPRSARESRLMPRLMRFPFALPATLFTLWKAKRIYG